MNTGRDIDSRSSETTRLVNQRPNESSYSYLNIANNICCITVLAVISYCCFRDGATLFSFHPVFMTLGWLILMTTAVNAVNPGDFATEWMPIRLRSSRHWLIQAFAGIMILIGFLIILSNKIINGKAHFVSTHGKLGLSSFILTMVTMLGGICVLYSLKLKQYVAPVYTKLIHATVGLVTFTLGIFTIGYALFSAWWTFGIVLRTICLILLALITVFTLLRPSLKVYFRLKERFENLN